MKLRFIQKMVAGALTVALVAAPSMSAFASSNYGNDYGNNSSSSSSGSGSSHKTAEDEVLDAVNEAIAAGGGESGTGSVSSIADIPTTSSVSGVTTTVQGVYLATCLNGTAITTGLSDIAGSYGLATGEIPYARFYNMDAKKSFLAQAVIDNAAAAVGGTVGPCFNIEIGKKANGQFALLSQEGNKIAVKVGVPRSFAQDGKTFAVVCVRPGGAVSVLQDTDSNPDTVTFETTGGQGAYAIIKY
ncbi:MAG: hypothetical protein K2O15_13425 [Lachnospiraceae bacterium]|nr:hypothetical protein [Lachnospiraceae bacterium]